MYYMQNLKWTQKKTCLLRKAATQVSIIKNNK